MQSEHIETSSESSSQDHASNAAPTSQYGFFDHRSTSPSLSAREEPVAPSRSESEWSLSPSSGQSPQGSPRSRLNSIDLSVHDDDATLLNANNGSFLELEGLVIPRVLKASGKRGSPDHSALLEFPEEVLFQVISHLNAVDLLTIKLVSRRFYNLVTSPHAWISAFSRYFLGPDALQKTGHVRASEAAVSELRTERRSFTRVTSNTSWTSEYLLRTKLLRCLARGKPSLPFAAPSHGKPGKGYATFTFHSNLHVSVNLLNAKFGDPFDKRSPHFIHGSSSRGRVNSSDKRGKFDGWGLHDSAQFLNFATSHPGTQPWGLGPGEVTGVPNVMNLSANHGVICGEGAPGGNAYYMSSGEKHGRYLSPFMGIAYHHFAVPKISQDEQCVTAAWIAKSFAMPRTSKGLIGMLVGSSSGTVSAYSLGQSGQHQQQRYERGELISRWLLSPGVPIISLVADDAYSDDRASQGRLCAVALNALGEVFVLNQLPLLSKVPKRHESQVERFHELRAWQTGLSATWNVVTPSIRTERSLDASQPDILPYFPLSVQSEQPIDVPEAVNQIPSLEKWIAKKPIDFRSLFTGWDMQRVLHVDFGGDDEKVAGENIIVLNCGVQDDSSASIIRYVRNVLPVNKPLDVGAGGGSVQAKGPSSSPSAEPLWSFNSVPTLNTSQAQSGDVIDQLKTEWRTSEFGFGRYRNVHITTSAIDESIYATTTCSEDILQSQTRNNSGISLEDHGVNAFKFPGQRARLFAVGTAAGTVFIWNARAPTSAAPTLRNVISPVRIIATDSPAVSSLALTSLYLVHGGSEGLVQAWDILGSTLDPVRTISSRSTLNARRRAVIAAQQNPNLQNVDVSHYAAGAVCLDPDPTILRGIVAIGNYLRYWSYSSADATGSVTKSYKRKLNRPSKNFGGGSGDVYLPSRRVGIKGIVNEEMRYRELDERERRAEEKEHRRIAGRFGLDLLGQDASEEELLAYAKILSEEEEANHHAKLNAERLDKNATPEAVEAHKNALSAEEYERWKFASWEERFDIATAQSSIQTPVSSRGADQNADDIAKAIELSLRDSTGEGSVSPSNQASYQQDLDMDMAKAISLSLGDESVTTAPTIPSGPSSVDDDMAKAIELSLLDAPSSPSPEPDANLPRTTSDQDFPALGSPPANSQTARGAKGKRRA